MADTGLLLWINSCLSATLVLISGLFAGLTIALMTQDELYLRVIALSGEAADRKNAQEVIKLLAQGKHWLLVTLLLGNCIASEALPVILDKVVGGGLLAVLSSTILIVIFSEIIPQSICARHSLNIGAYMAPFVSACMYTLAPVAWPVGRLLDLCVGGGHSPAYKRTELMTLFSLHEHLGNPDERLRSDQVRMVKSTLGMVNKMVIHIMTPISEVFSLPADAILDPHMMNRIKAHGYSQIPIYSPGDRNDIIGSFPTKQLLKYNPKPHRRVCDFDWAPVPVIHAKTTQLHLLKTFQETNHEIILVGRQEKNTILGIVTRRDMAEALIGHNILTKHKRRQPIQKEERTLRQKQPRSMTRAHQATPVQSIFEKPQTHVLFKLAPEEELLPLWVKSNLPTNYGSFDYVNSYIRNYLTETKPCQEIELASTYHA